jgi:hypothetical protein
VVRYSRKVGVLRVIAFASAAVLVSAVNGCSSPERDEAGWTVDRAESITNIRGMTVRVLQCRGLGTAAGEKGVRRYQRFVCEAGARRVGESYDTVGVFYEIRVRASGGYALENVRFIGGPGIP